MRVYKRRRPRNVVSCRISSVEQEWFPSERMSKCLERCKVWLPCCEGSDSEQGNGEDDADIDPDVDPDVDVDVEPRVRSEINSRNPSDLHVPRKSSNPPVKTDGFRTRSLVYIPPESSIVQLVQDEDLQERVDTFYRYLAESVGGGRAFHLAVSRDKIFQDSYRSMGGQSLKKAGLNISFNEGSIDAGGPTREWFTCLSQHMVSAEVGLFRVVGDQTTFEPNPASGVGNRAHLAQFEFCGQFVGMAIEKKTVLDCAFSRVVYKHLLNLPVGFEDLKSVDPETYRSYSKMLPKGGKESEVDPADVSLTYTATVIDGRDRKVEKELIKGGKDIEVNRDNVEEYVNLYAQFVLVDAIRDQLKAFAKGFFAVIPQELISLFKPIELEYLIRGVPEINIEDLKRNTEYVGYSSNSAVIGYFWRAVESFTEEERVKLVQFFSGSSRAPPGGFAKLIGARGSPQRFTINRGSGGIKSLPAAHTCFNSIDLPQYSTYEDTRQKLQQAITMTVGFAFG